MDTVNWRKLTWRALVVNAKEQAGIKVTAKLLKAAHQEVVEELVRKGRKLDFTCGHCGSPIDAEISGCWACGSVIDDGGMEPEVTLDELRRRARNLEIDPSCMGREDLIRVIELEETRRREAAEAVDLSGVEAANVNEKLTEMMGDGWSKKDTLLYTGYWDPSGVKRIAVYKRGLYVRFAVEDGILDKFDGLQFLDAQERKRRHYGRDNYMYRGDLLKEVLVVCRAVLGKYS